jgi:hypothetical protein
MAEFFPVLTMMAAPVAILLMIRHRTVRQNQIAQAPNQPPPRWGDGEPPTPSK